MGFFSQFKMPDINEIIAQAKDTPGAVIIDVRGPSEVAGGVIPGALWIPMNDLGQIEQKVPEKDTPIFVYCAAGGRAARAKAEWESRGYTQVTNAGGIRRYTGKTVKLS